MRFHLLVGLVCCASLLVSRPTAAQDDATAQAIIATSLAAVTERTGLSGFLSTPADPAPSASAEWRRALFAAATERGLTVAQCPRAQSPGYGTTCPCEARRAAFEFSEPRFEGLTASIVWTVHARGDDGVLFGNSFRVFLRREGTRWTVTSLALTWAT